MGEADGDSGLNKIEVPVYWLPRDLWACSVPGGSSVIADRIFAHKPPSSQPISLSGTPLSAPSPCVWGGDGSSLVVQGCVTVPRSLLALITDTAAPKALGSRRLPLLLPFTPTAPRSFGPAFPWEVFMWSGSFHLGLREFRDPTGTTAWVSPFRPAGVPGGRGLAWRAQGTCCMWSWLRAEKGQGGNRVAPRHRAHPAQPPDPLGLPSEGKRLPRSPACPQYSRACEEGRGGRLRAQTAGSSPVYLGPRRERGH